MRKLIRAAVRRYIPLSLLAAASVQANTGLPFADLDTGARSASLAGAVVAVPGPQASSYNPAALQGASGRSFVFTHSEWIQQIDQDYLALVWNGPVQAFGLAAHVTRSGGLERRVGPTAEALGEFSLRESLFEAVYARALNPRLRLGTALKLIHQSIYLEAAAGAAVDLGLLYQVAPGLQMGLSLRNLGGMGELERAATPLPRSVRLGLAYSGRPGLLVGLQAQRRRGGSTEAAAGVQYRLHPKLNARAGYQLADSRNLSLGLGLLGARWELDYAYLPFANGLGQVHRFSLCLHGGA
ncbi:MAG: PorV/PorQ family protein [Candidatus Latescibacteria bacterium]|nr:PorV/PorQ family protein [Candidatus Latescibacterota bacterium]